MLPGDEWMVESENKSKARLKEELVRLRTDVFLDYLSSYNRLKNKETKERLLRAVEYLKEVAPFFQFNGES